MPLFAKDLGPCQLTFGGVDLGSTRGGVMFRHTEEDRQVLEDQRGTTPVDEILVGTQTEVECNLTRSALATIEALVSGASGSGTNVTSGRITVKSAVGKSRVDTAKVLLIKPIVNGVASTDDTTWVKCFAAAPKADVELQYDFENQRVLNFTFACYPTDSTGATGAKNRIWQIGPDA